MRAQSFSHIIFVTIATLGGLQLIGCNPVDANRNLQRQLSDPGGKNRETPHRSDPGGQPGEIKVNGAVVQLSAQGPQLDSRLSTISLGGIGRDGTVAPVSDSYRTKLSPTSSVDFGNEQASKALFSFGCDQNFVHEFLAEDELDLQLPAAPANQTLEARAHTILICGVPQEFDKLISLNLKAEHLVLKGFSFFSKNSGGGIVLSANRLTLEGSSQIFTQGLESTIAVSLTPTIELNVKASLDSRNQGGLVLKSTGSSFKPRDRQPLIY